MAGFLIYSICFWAVQSSFGQPPGEGFGDRGGGGGRGGGRGGPRDEGSVWGEPRGPDVPREGPRRWEMDDDIIDQVMKSIEKKDPAKAKELAQLREKDPDKFREEIKIQGREELANIFRERMESGRRRFQTEYIEWLEKNYPQEAELLAKHKDKGPEAYMKRLDSSVSKYGEIFRASRENPELAIVLKEDLELKEKRDDLVKKIKDAKNDDEKKKLSAQLEEVASSRFDLIVRRKEIAYEQLLKKLEELKQQIGQSKDEIAKWKDQKFKDDSVKKHIEDLMGGGPRFRWD
jgi:hypothetical protein